MTAQAPDFRPLQRVLDGEVTAEHTDTSTVISLVEERASIDKRLVESGRAKVRTVTDRVEQILQDTLRVEAIEVTRVPVGRTLELGETAPELRTEGDLTIVPVLEEILVVEKRLVLKEELHIRRHATVEEVSVPVILRKQRAAIERVDAKGQVTTEDTP